MLSAAKAGTAQVRHGSPAAHATSYGDHLLSPPPAPGGASPPRSLSRSRLDARMMYAPAPCRMRESESAVGRWNLAVLTLTFVIALFLGTADEFENGPKMRLWLIAN